MSDEVSVVGRRVESTGQEPQPTSTLHSAFVLLRVLGRVQQHPVGVSQLAAETGIPKTTVHRLLEQLAQENVVERREHRWTFAAGLYELDRRHFDLASIAHPRLRSMSQATGATLFLYDATGRKLKALSRAYGSRFTRIVSPSHQSLTAESPASALFQALATGQMAHEHGAVPVEYSCIATPFSLPSGEAAVLAMGLPMTRDMEAFKRPLDRVATLIESEMRRLTSQCGRRLPVSYIRPKPL
jgi:hypothetical protein